MFNKKTVKDISLKNKTILLRTDFNVPLENGAIADDLRIKAALPTIQYLLENSAKKIIIISHLGRPEGRRASEFSLRPVAIRLQELLPNTPVSFLPEISGPDVELAVEGLPQSGILLLENLRFSPDEEKNSEEFAEEIVASTHADIFVQDGFAVVHRAHASTDAITRVVPSVAGLLLEKEIMNLSAAIKNPARPLLVVIGGAKVTDKQPLIDAFLPLADQIFVGGKIAADGYRPSSPKIYVAEDFATDFTGAKLDIGPLSIKKLQDFVAASKTIVWNGVLGKSEDVDFAKGSAAAAIAMGESSAKTIIGGGDTAAFVEQLQEAHANLNYSLVSTGGGASLEFLSGQELPGLSSLEDK